MVNMSEDFFAFYIRIELWQAEEEEEEEKPPIFSITKSSAELKLSQLWAKSNQTTIFFFFQWNRGWMDVNK